MERLYKELKQAHIAFQRVGALLDELGDNQDTDLYEFLNETWLKLVDKLTTLQLEIGKGE